MAKAKIQYSCTACGASHTKWAGQCGDCGEWNTMSETITAITTNNRQGFAGKKGNAQIQALKDIPMHADMRTPTNISELDRVLGTLYASVEGCFQSLLRIGFASRFSDS